jgi:hypothetical protein
MYVGRIGEIRNAYQSYNIRRKEELFRTFDTEGATIQKWTLRMERTTLAQDTLK